MPVPMNLPLMIPELAIYGFIAGRIVYSILFSLTGRLAAYRSVFQFVEMIWGPGLVTAIHQIIILPLLSGLYINWIED